MAETKYRARPDFLEEAFGGFLRKNDIIFNFKILSATTSAHFLIPDISIIRVPTLVVRLESLILSVQSLISPVPQAANFHKTGF